MKTFAIALLALIGATQGAKLTISREAPAESAGRNYQVDFQ